MQIYFTNTDPNESLTHDHYLFSTGFSDKKYFYGIEYGSNPSAFDDIVIYDTIGRSIPIDVNSVENLIDALQRVRTFIGIVKQHDTLNTTLDNIADAEQKVGL